jgi:hypothetical protein
MSRAPAAADALPMGGVDGDIAAGMTSAAPQCDASAQSVNVTFRIERVSLYELFLFLYGLLV